MDLSSGSRMARSMRSRRWSGRGRRLGKGNDRPGQQPYHPRRPDLERLFAKRMGATAYELDSSHVPMLSQPERVIDVIRTAAKAVQAATVAA
jgi:hypothetical protein